MSNEKGTVSVKLPSGELVCEWVGVEVWDRYLDKVRADSLLAGQKEVIMAACISHETGDLMALLDRFPAVVPLLHNAIDGLCGSDHKFTHSLEEMTFSAVVDGEPLVFNAPDGGSYETLQTNMGDEKLSYGPTLRQFLKGQAQDKERFESVVEKYPTIVGPALPAMAQVAGAGFEITVKKG